MECGEECLFCGGKVICSKCVELKERIWSNCNRSFGACKYWFIGKKEGFYNDRYAHLTALIWKNGEDYCGTSYLTIYIPLELKLEDFDSPKAKWLFTPIKDLIQKTFSGSTIIDKIEYSDFKFREQTTLF